MKNPSSASPSSIAYRRARARQIPTEIGVYALCDLDGVPVYIGQSEDGIRARVRRHITSARSDVIANRQIDVWEIAYVLCWPLKDKAKLGPSERFLFHQFHTKSPLMNGSVPAKVEKLSFSLPEPIRIQLMQDHEIEERKLVERRLPRQAKHFTELLDHFLNVKDAKELYLALQAHFARLNRYFANLRPSIQEDDSESSA